MCLDYTPCRQVLEDPRENPMVRHEAAEALGSIADEQCVELLKQVRGCWARVEGAGRERCCMAMWGAAAAAAVQ